MEQIRSFTGDLFESSLHRVIELPKGLIGLVQGREQALDERAEPMALLGAGLTCRHPLDVARR